MTDRIQVGDLVQIVRSCCTGFARGQSVFVVGCFWDEGIPTVCMHCGTSIPIEPQARQNSKSKACPVSWLKRIPPLEELEGVKTDEPIKEPA